MDYLTEYQRKLMDGAGVAEQIRSGDHLHISGACAVPLSIDRALAGLIGARQNIHVTGFMHFGTHQSFFQAPGAEKTFQFNSVFHTRSWAQADRMGSSAYIPTHLRNAVRDVEYTAPELDWLIVGVSPMDKNGYFTLAGGALIEGDLIDRARHIAVEVLEGAPRLFGDTMLHISQVDAIVEAGNQVTPMPMRTPDEVDARLGKHVAELVEDGATIQLGFGGVVDALVKELKNRHDLGIHSEVVTDSTMELLECGAVNNKKKTLCRGQTVASFWGGSEKFSRYLDDNPAFQFRSASYTNDPNILAQNVKMTSINAALQVDLGGQCASESIGARQFSGAGGQVDTAVGAQMAPGGKSIIAVRSTVDLKDPVTGEKIVKSRIVPTLDQGAVVTLTRTNVHFVITEYGAVCLRGLSVKDRAKALISIAHPDFRAQLEEEFERYYGLPLH